MTEAPKRNRGLYFSRGISPEEMKYELKGTREPWSFRDMVIDNVKDDHQPDILDLEKTYEMARGRREEFRGIFSFLHANCLTK